MWKQCLIVVSLLWLGGCSQNGVTRYQVEEPERFPILRAIGYAVVDVQPGPSQGEKMLQAIREEKAWHSSFSGWLYRIAHNLVIDFYRQRDRHGHVSLDDNPTLSDENDNPVENVAAQMEAEQVRFAMRQLTDEQAEVLSLRFLEGYSIQEVASMMNKTEGAIKALQYRAVATLRQLLEYSQASP